jgi:hypothetical protein
MSAMSLNSKINILQSTAFSSCCIQVVQQLTKHGMLKARVIGNSQNSSIIEHTRVVAEKYNLDAKLEPIIVKRNTCDNPLVCAFICNTIYTANYDNKGNVISIKVEKSIPP